MAAETKAVMEQHINILLFKVLTLLFHCLARSEETGTQDAR
jgi:hypothetical protein